MGWNEGGWSGRSAAGGGGGNAFAQQVIQVPITAVNGTNTITSVTSIPSGGVVYECTVDVTSGFAAGATITVGQSGHLTEFQGTGDNTPATPGLYTKNQVTSPATAAPLVVTVVSTTTAGAGVAYVRYSVPQS